jgi:hypothetical protein
MINSLRFELQIRSLTRGSQRIGTVLKTTSHQLAPGLLSFCHISEPALSLSKGPGLSHAGLRIL